jgi:Mor family transcriptional regulator
MATQPDEILEKEADKYQIRISDLHGEVRAIAKLIGLKAALQLASEYGGESIYIPKNQAITRIVRNRAICEEFNGSNCQELARKYRMTTRYIRDILKKKNKYKTKEQQLNLF